MHTSDQKKAIIKLWQEHLQQFCLIRKNILVRINGFVVAGTEIDIQEGINEYRIRVFVHSFDHSENDQIYFDGYRDYYYSFARHGYGRRVLGAFTPFPNFVESIKAESALDDHLTISKIINFYKDKSVLGPENFNTIRALSVAIYMRDGIQKAISYLDSQEEKFYKWNEGTQSLLGGDWKIWRESVANCLNIDTINENKRRFILKHKRKKLIDFDISRS